MTETGLSAAVSAALALGFVVGFFTARIVDKIKQMFTRGKRS